MFMTKQRFGFSGEGNTGGSVLLDLSAADDLIGFKQAVEEDGSAIDEAGFWYSRPSSGKKMGFLQRTPLMVAALFGSTGVLKYILSTYTTCGIDVNRASVSDGATALHCAAAGGSPATAEVVKLLVEASADVNSVDSNGNRPGDLVAASSPVLSDSMGALNMLLNINKDGKLSPSLRAIKSEKKEYPVDPSMPDINDGVYSTDEFRMYTFKVKPCSRAYSHDWTECPFVHPGENARRRDPRRYHYSCVPCPDFRKGNCVRGDACEYAHGVFECWLHPAQYRTRLCKDEVGCNRRICFFAHRPEELRPLYPSTGSAIPSPRSVGLDTGSAVMSPLSLNSTSVLLGTPPMSPTASVGSNWQFGAAANLQGSRLKATRSARDLIMDDLVELENQQKFLDDLAAVSSSPPMQQPWIGSLTSASLLASSVGSRSGKFRNMSTASAMQSANLEDMFTSELMSQMAAIDSVGLDRGSVSQLKAAAAAATMAQMQSTMRSSPNYGLSSSPVRASSLRVGSERNGGCSLSTMSPSLATALMNSSRSTAFAKRSMSFRDRGASMVPSSASRIDDWSSPTGKLDWGVQGDELNKLRKSASFGFRNKGGAVAKEAMAEVPDVSWVQSLVKEGPTGCEFDGLSHDQLPRGFPRPDVSASALGVVPWMDQLYTEQEQMVA